MTTTVFPVLGDSGGYDEVYKYARNLASYTCGRMGLYGIDRDDVFTDAYMAAVEASKSYDGLDNPTCSLKTWVWRIGYRRIVDGLRNRNWFTQNDIRLTLVEPLPPIDHHISSSDYREVFEQHYEEPGYNEFDDSDETVNQLRTVRGCFPQLTPAQREWIELVLTGLTQSQIARKLGVSDGAVTHRRSGAIKRIQDLIAA